MPGRTRRDSARGTGLSRALSALRQRAELSQTQLADAVDLRQNAISRFEGARAVPSPEQLAALLDALRATPEERRNITELARRERSFKPEDVPARVILESGVASFQQRLYDLEDEATLVRSFHPTTILGVLQTEAYITAVFQGHVSDNELGRAVAQRLQRHRLLLDGSDRHWVLLQTEGALRWNFAGARVMAEQMDSIAEVAASSDHIRVGIIPAMRPVDRAQPLHGFHIYDFPERKYRRDPRMAHFGTHSGSAILGEARANAEYVSLFERLERLAVYGDEARTLLERIADDYRQLDQ